MFIEYCFYRFIILHILPVYNYSPNPEVTQKDGLREPQPPVCRESQPPVFREPQPPILRVPQLSKQM